MLERWMEYSPAYPNGSSWTTGRRWPVGPSEYCRNPACDKNLLKSPYPLQLALLFPWPTANNVPGCSVSFACSSRRILSRNCDQRILEQPLRKSSRIPKMWPVTQEGLCLSTPKSANSSLRVGSGEAPSPSNTQSQSYISNKIHLSTHLQDSLLGRDVMIRERYLKCLERLQTRYEFGNIN